MTLENRLELIGNYIDIVEKQELSDSKVYDGFSPTEHFLLTKIKGIWKYVEGVKKTKYFIYNKERNFEFLTT